MNSCHPKPLKKQLPNQTYMNAFHMMMFDKAVGVNLNLILPEMRQLRHMTSAGSEKG